MTGTQSIKTRVIERESFEPGAIKSKSTLRNTAMTKNSFEKSDADKTYLASANSPVRRLAHSGDRLHEDPVSAGRILFRWLILLSMTLSFASCKEETYNLNAPDYYQFHLEAGRAMCAKMDECYAPFLRTLRPEYQRDVNRESCMQALKKDLKEKITIHTPEMQQLSRVCYHQLLQRNCKEFLVGTAFIPACQELMELTSKEFQKHPVLLRSLNQTNG